MNLPLSTLVASVMLLALPAALPAQEAVTTTSPVSVVPHLIKFSGALPGASNKAETVDVKFALYAAQTGGEALWSETQQVSLDTTGKYSVLLGSVAALPNSVFASGQARWIGVTLGSEQESARTILVATPYSLKASDAETLGGHPVSDFTLKNAAQPTSGTNITQINVGNGVTGGGTGPTVTLGLSSTYLENLGNGIYPQLGGTNTLTGKNTYTAGKLLLGTSPVLSAANVTGTSPVTATVSGNTVKIGLSDSALLTLGNGVYSQLTAANSFTAPQSIHTGDGDAVTAVSTEAGATGVFGENNTNNAVGDYGIGDVALYGIAPGGLTYNIGSLGSYDAFSNEFSALSGSGVGVGAWGDGGPAGAVGDGVIGTTDTGNAVVGYTAASYAVIYGQSDYTGDSGFLFSVISSNTGGTCTADTDGNFSCTGAYAVSNLTPDKHQIETYGVQSSENWVEDFGSGQLQSGHAVITLDPTFAKIVNTGVGYHVFLTPKGESENLYVANESGSGFEVREAHNGTSAIAFDYRIVAKRSGKESMRLVDRTEFNKTHPASLQADMQAKHPNVKITKRPPLGGIKMASSSAKP